MKSKLKLGRLLIVAIGGIAVLGLVFYVLYLAFGKEEEVLSYAQMPIESGYEYDVSDNYLTYMTEDSVEQVNLKSNSMISIPLHAENIGFSVSSSMTAFYAGSDFLIRGHDYVPLTGTIRSLAAGNKYCAVLMKSRGSGLDSIVIFNASGQLMFEPIDFSDNKVVSFGFDTADGRETLWVICVNIESASPATTVRLYDFNNNGSMSYYPVFYDQFVEQLAFSEDSVFIIGTQHIVRYSRTGSREQYRVGIYGKKVVDYRIGDDYVYFLLQPRNTENAKHVLYVMGLAESDSANETSMTLSCGEDIVNCFLQSGGIRVITPTRYLSYSYSGKLSHEVPLVNKTDTAVKLDSNRFLLVSGNDCYFVTILV